MRYVESRSIFYDREEAYRIYVTDSLKALGGFHDRYANMIKRETAKEETRTPEEIKDTIKEKLAKLGGESK